MANRPEGISLPQLFFFRARTLEAIQAEVLRINLETPASEHNGRIFNPPIKDDNQWVITWMEFTKVDLDVTDLLSR